MKHPEWLGDKEKVERLLRRTGLMNAKSEQLKLMRLIIQYRYIQMMSVTETMMRLTFDDGISISRSAYYRAFNKAIRILEKNGTK
jgi:hypothetical protein